MFKKRIIEVIDTLEQGGAQQFLFDLLVELKNDFEFLVLSFESGPYFERFKKAGIKIKILDLAPAKIGLKYPNNLKKVKNWLSSNFDQFDPHIIQTHLLGADVWARLIASKDIKVIQTIHSAESFRGNLFNKKGLKTWFFDRYLEKKTKLIVAVSLAAKQTLLKQGINEKKIKVIPTAIKIRNFVPDVSAKKRIRKEMKCKEEDLIIGSVGRLDKVKGFDTLIQAFSKISVKYKNTFLYIIGEGKERKYLEQLIANSNLKNKVKLLGQKQNISDFLNAFDFFVSSSYWEGLPLAVLEAMANKKTIIATACGGTKEVIVDEKTGLLARIGDARSLEQKIDEAIKNPSLAKILSQNAFLKVREYDIGNIAKKYKQIYNLL